MVPGFQQDLQRLRTMVDLLTKELAAHKQALAELLAENTALREQLEAAKTPAAGGQP